MKYREKYLKWIESEHVDDKTKEELKGLSESEIEDRFYCDMEFGTGGLRGVMAAGTNRMNIYTVRHATQGLANEIISCDGASEKGVVIAFDSRNNSELFAYECAKVLSSNGIKTYLFDKLRPTPELSFAVRYLGCARGVVITASHNPKEYNGYKVYDERGTQISLEIAERILGYINKTDIFNDIKINDNNDIVKIGEEIDKAYIEAVKAQSLGQEIPQDYKVVYTPIHGSGNVLVRQILSEIGVGNVFVVPEQEMPDGDFTTVISPNPEHPQTLSLAVEYAKKNNADIVLGTDPDSDRIGVAICDKSGNYILLNGNQTGVIICEYILRKLKERSDLPEKGTVIKTIVTTEMIKSITEDYGVQMDDVLTGFKFIGDKIKQFEDKGEKERFLFGLEESYGYLKGTYARDKDAVVAAMLITEVAAECKENGVTLYERLMHLYDRYGCHLEKLETKTFNGIDGRKQIDIIMEKFRTQKIPFKVCEMKDYLNGIDGLPKSDVLKFYVENGWFAVRPSGTEPKIKFYFGIKEPTVELANEKLEEFVDRIMNFAEVD